MRGGGGEAGGTQRAISFNLMQQLPKLKFVIKIKKNTVDGQQLIYRKDLLRTLITLFMCTH